MKFVPRGLFNDKKGQKFALDITNGIFLTETHNPNLNIDSFPYLNHQLTVRQHFFM